MNRHLGRTYLGTGSGRQASGSHPGDRQKSFIVVAALMGIYLIGVNTLLNIEAGGGSYGTRTRRMSVSPTSVPGRSGRAACM